MVLVVELEQDEACYSLAIKEHRMSNAEHQATLQVCPVQLYLCMGIIVPHW